MLQPCARPIKLETLNRKRLAIDASIWIYQFLKAVRDKEGHALRNAHVVGFFRRVCKLLFVGVKPVFVFDGGAPALKRETVQRRKRRREGRREDAVKTAGKLLGVQMRRRAELERDEERGKRRRPEEEEEEEEGIKEGEEDQLVYVEELQMTPQERARNRQFKKTDAYHLPALDPNGFQAMGAPNDPRVMSQPELEEYARQFHSGEDINLYDFSAIDFNGLFFKSLPAGDRYNILNAARLRSRLRMGYSKEQLDGMFPDRMAFSRFQIERVKERNELTQRLMGINGMNGDDDGGFGSRVAGEKGKEYVLVKNDGVEGGWALGVVSNNTTGGDRNQPIDVDGVEKKFITAGMLYGDAEEDEEAEEEGFEDVPIGGLNRLLKRPAPNVLIPSNQFESDEVIKQRQALYSARRNAAKTTSTPPPHPASPDEIDSLFVPQTGKTVGAYADTDIDDKTMADLFENISRDHSDDDLDLAIAMSLEHDDNNESENTKTNTNTSDTAAESRVGTGAGADAGAGPTSTTYNGPKPDQRLEFNEKNAQIGRGVASMWNARARGVAAAATPSGPFLDDSDDDEELGEVFKGSLERVSKVAGTYDKGPSADLKKRKNSHEGVGEKKQLVGSGTLKLLSSVQDSSSTSQPSRFDGPLPFKPLNLGKSILTKKKKKVDEGEAGGFEKPVEAERQKPPKPIPPWFSGDVRDITGSKKGFEHYGYENKEVGDGAFRGPLKKQETGEVIDLDELGENTGGIIEVESSGDERGDDVVMGDVLPINTEARMSDIADRSGAEPSSSRLLSDDQRSKSHLTQGGTPLPQGDSDSEVMIEWEASDLEDVPRKPASEVRTFDEAGGQSPTRTSQSLTPEFENVGIEESRSELQSSVPLAANHNLMPTHLQDRESIDGPTLDNLEADDEDQYSDPEEAELMRQLAIEAEEHARFASTLNSKSQLQNAEDYEQELRQLRNQQKKDRRDADEVSQIMITECQQLLKLFGIPYVTAPMEAEAQCAELVSLGLVDGIVTDDSDIFLFGGTRVYKNMFNQAKFVECYLSSDLEKEYSLDRQKLIGVAHLLGSDYTEGLPSVGPVTALEILSEFENLEAFAAWWSQVQLGQKLPAEDAANPFRRKFKRTASKLFLPHTFPDKRVDQAYLHPEVDKDPSPFAWGVPDLDALRQFLMATIGWSQERTDEVLVPVIKDMNRREDEGTQANITRFFGGGVGVGSQTNSAGSAYAPRRRKEKSKRMESALGRLHAKAKKGTSGDMDESSVAADQETDGVNDSVGKEGEAETTNRSKTTKPRKRAAPANISDSNSGEDEDYEAPTKPRKRGQPRRTSQRQ